MSLYFLGSDIIITLVSVLPCWRVKWLVQVTAMPWWEHFPPGVCIYHGTYHSLLYLFGWPNAALYNYTLSFSLCGKPQKVAVTHKYLDSFLPYPLVLVEWVWMPRYGSCTIYKIVLIACNKNLNICSGKEGWQCAIHVLDPTLMQLILYFKVCYLHYPLSYSTICSKWLSLGYKPCNPNSN